jgi:hypothetical protein
LEPLLTIINQQLKFVSNDTHDAMAQQGNAPCLATVMVSHHWRNLFCHLSAAVLAYALGETSYEATAESPSKTWDLVRVDWGFQPKK